MRRKSITIRSNLLSKRNEENDEGANKENSNILLFRYSVKMEISSEPQSFGRNSQMSSDIFRGIFPLDERSRR